MRVRHLVVVMRSTFVSFELVNKNSKSVVPKLDDTIVQGAEEPGSGRVEVDALHSLRLSLELDQHV